MPGKKMVDMATFLAYGIAKEASRNIEALKLVAIPVEKIKASTNHDPRDPNATVPSATTTPDPPEHPEESVPIDERLPLSHAEWERQAKVPFRAGSHGPVRLPFESKLPEAIPGHVLVPRNFVDTITSNYSRLSPEHVAFITKKTTEEVRLGSVEEVTEWTQVRLLLPIFVAVHPVTGKLRIIYDGRALNLHLVDANGSVHYESLRDTMLLRARVATKLDLQAAFRHVAIHDDDVPYFGFVVNEKVYRYRCLPFGCSWSPALYARLLQPTIDAIRRLGIRIMWYVDDILVVADTRSDLDSALLRVMQMLASHGWKVAPDKSYCHAYTTIPFLGLLTSFDPDGNVTLSVPRSKRDRIVNELTEMLHCHFTSVHALQKITGRLAFIRIVVTELGFTRASFDGAIAAALRHGTSSIPVIGRLQEDAVSILALLKDDGILSRVATVPTAASRVPVNPRAPFKAPSLSPCSGWSRAGTFSSYEIALSSAAREILAITNGVIALDLRDAALMWHSDSTCAVAAINKWGSAATGVADALKDLFSELRRRNLSIEIVHVRRELELMPIADYLSRVGWRDRQAEWALAPRDVRRVCTNLGLRCTGDLFASARNRRFKIFCSRFLEGDSRGDAMYLPWYDRSWWAFPPISLRSRVIHRLVSHLRSSQAAVSDRSRRNVINMILVIPQVNKPDPDSSIWAELTPAIVRSVVLHFAPSSESTRPPLLPNLRLLGDRGRLAPRPPPWTLVAHRIRIASPST
jgi:Reverse transcriptase (RNA-dependent DNA polymerase)